MICSLVSRSVSETLIVRSKGSAPLWTFTSVPTVARIAMAQPITVRRNRFRVTSIFLARAISSARAKQRNLRHLAEIHADRIAAELRRPRRAAAADRPAPPGTSPLASCSALCLLGVRSARAAS